VRITWHVHFSSLCLTIIVNIFAKKKFVGFLKFRGVKIKENAKGKRKRKRTLSKDKIKIERKRTF
jgi:hypothetical protein